MTLSRRSLITGLISLVAAPAIVRAGSLMPVKVMAAAEWEYGVGVYRAADPVFEEIRWEFPAFIQNFGVVYNKADALWYWERRRMS